MSTQVSIRCKRDGNIESAPRYVVRRQQVDGRQPWTTCAQCGTKLIFPRVGPCECTSELYLMPGEWCADCGRPYDARIDDYRVDARDLHRLERR